MLGRAGVPVTGAGADEPLPAPAIPVAVSDLGLRETNPLAAPLLAVLDLAGERLTATSVAALLDHPAVVSRLGLAPEDGARLLELVVHGGLRWGLDAGERVAAGYPEAPHNTLRFAAERAVLGALVGTPEAPPLVVGRAGPKIEPLALHGSEDVALAGVVAAFTATLERVRARLAAPRPAPLWRDALIETLDDLAVAADGDEWQRLQVVQILDEWAAGVGPEPVLAREAVAAWLAQRFEHPVAGDRPITGAVTVCALEPMRSVPFRVVALVGMDDGVFPRQSVRPAWDPLADGELGLAAPDRRAADRHLLLEAVLSARERLWLLWTGQDPHTFEHRPAAVPVEGLIDAIAAVTGRARETFVRVAPLQPWSERTFRAGPVYDPALARAARARGARAGAPPAPWRAPVVPEDHPPALWTPDELARALHRPARALLRDRLGVRGADEGPALDDRLPSDVALTWDDHRELVTRALDSHASGVEPAAEVERAVARLSARGALPLGARGQALAREQVEALVAQAARVTARLGERMDPLEVRLEVGGVVVADHVGEVGRHDDRLVLVHVAAGSRDPGHGYRLTAWVKAVCAVAAGHPVQEVCVVGLDRTRTMTPPADADAARSLVAGMVELAQSARTEPLPLFPHTSPALAQALARGYDEPGRLAAVARQAFFGGDFKRGDLHEPEIADLFAGYDPAQDILARGLEAPVVDLARRVWLPLVRSRVRGGRSRRGGGGQ